MNKVYYYTDIVTEEDFPIIAADFGITYELVNEVVDQLAKNGTVSLRAYSGGARSKIEEMLKVVGTSPVKMEEENEEEPLIPNDVEVENKAAITLISNLTDSFGPNFILHEDFGLTINPDNPPTITQSYEALANMLGFRNVAAQAEDKSNWILGALVDTCEKFHGERFNVSQICEETEKSYNTVITAVGVHKAFPPGKRYPELTFTHHKEAWYANMFKTEEKASEEVKKEAEKKNIEAKKLILQIANDHGLSVKTTRDMCNFVKRHGIEPLEGVKSSEQVHHLIEASKELKADYLVCDEKNQWTRIKTNTTEIPNGKIVINLKAMEVTADGLTLPIAKH